MAAAGRTGLTPAERRRLEPLAAALGRAARPGRPRLELVAGSLDGAASAGLLAGTFNPLTLAHTALATAGRRAGLDRVVLVMAPASLDKEGVERAHPLDRLAWAADWARGRSWAAAAVSSAPLLVDMAEALGAAGPARISLLLGADKAIQLVDPRYYDDPEAALARLARAASVKVAVRDGYEVPELPLAAEPLRTPGWVPSRSASAAREVAGAGGDLRGLVPARVAASVARLGVYDPGPGYEVRAAALNELVAKLAD
jgi:nicotinic acid mononucleotide adenylyltransferase